LKQTLLTLSGKTILITRSKHASTDILRMFEARGASIVCLPTIEIADPDSWTECDAIIWKLTEYDSVCFTSRNAVEKFIQRIRLIRPQAVNILATRNVYAVGEKTKSLLETNGFSVQPLPQKHSAESLAHSFYGQDISGKHFLFPKGNLASDVLPKELRSLGACVEELVTYKTVIPELENLERVRALLTDKKIDVLTFFSPSSVRNFLELMGLELVQQCVIAVIGPTTAEAAREAGLEVPVVAKQQTTESLVQGIFEYIDKM